MLKAKRLTKNCTVGGEAKLRGRLWNSLSRGHYPPIYQYAGKGFIYFITPQLICRGEYTYIFCGFFHVSLCGIVNQPFNFSYHWLLPKEFFSFPWPTKSLARTLVVSWPLFRRNKIRRRMWNRTADIVRFCFTWSVLPIESPKKLFGGL